MKQLTTNQKTEVQTTIAFLFILAFAFGVAWSMNKPPLTTEEKWDKFVRRTKNCGDLGCEIQYQKIFGEPSGF